MPLPLPLGKPLAPDSAPPGPQDTASRTYLVAKGRARAGSHVSLSMLANWEEVVGLLEAAGLLKLEMDGRRVVRADNE